MILFSWKINLTLFFFVILPKEIPKLRLIVLKIKIIYLYSKLISTTDTDYDYLQGTKPVFSIVVVRFLLTDIDHLQKSRRKEESSLLLLTIPPFYNHSRIYLHIYIYNSYF